MGKRYKAIPEYYDAEYAEKEMLRLDVPFFLEHLPHRRQEVLELAVGTGRAAIPIAQAGHRVVGIDYDVRMLALARRKRNSVGLSERELKLLPGDMTRFNVNRRFDWACVFFNTFLALTTLKEQDRCLQSVHRHLKKGGRLWLDIFNPDLGLLAEPIATRRDAHAFHVPELDRTVFSWADISRIGATQIQRCVFYYEWFDSFGQEHRQKIEFDLTHIFPRELQLLAERNGFRLERLYGNYDGSPLDSNSHRMIACCVKA